MVPKSIQLNAPLPLGWTLTGLSDPSSDGANLFRSVTGPSSSLTFPSAQATYLLLRFQLFSSHSAVSAQVHLNGTLLGETRVPPNVYTDVAELGGFTRQGQNVLTIDYRCGGQPCKAPILQYWASLEFRPPATTNAREQIGFAAQRWNLNVPGTPLTIVGATPMLFDGANYFRQVKGKGFRLGWAEEARPLNVTFQVEAAEPLQVISRVGGQKVAVASSVARGDGRQVASAAVPLLAHGHAQALDVEIQCLRSGTGCAVLYFPRVTVLPEQANSPLSGWVAVLAAACVLLALTALLGLRRTGP
jgi:hypothetical protein